MQPVNYHIIPKLLFEVEILGHSAKKISKLANIRYDKVKNKETELTLQEMEAIWTVCIEQTGISELGFYIGLRMNTESMGLLGQLYRNASTIGESLELAVRYRELVTDLFSYKYVKGKETVSLSLIPDTELAQKYPILSEHRCLLSLGITAKMNEILALRPSRIKKLILPPTLKSHLLLADYFGLIPEKEGENYVMIIDMDDLNIEIISTNLEVLTHLINYAESLLTKENTVWTNRVRQQLIQGYKKNFASIQVIAQSLNVSSRSLQRKLKEEHTSFQIILNEVRLELVKHYYGKSANFKELASHLGFSSASNLSRAFKQWSGKSLKSYFTEKMH